MKRKPFPFEFVLDLLESEPVEVKNVFGTKGIYSRGKIYLLLQRDPAGKSTGVWVATTPEHLPSLMKSFKSMVLNDHFGEPSGDWAFLSESSADFTRSVKRICRLIQAGDPRIGRRSKGNKR